MKIIDIDENVTKEDFHREHACWVDAVLSGTHHALARKLIQDLEFHMRQSKPTMAAVPTFMLNYFVDITPKGFFPAVVSELNDSWSIFMIFPESKSRKV